MSDGVKVVEADQTAVQIQTTVVCRCPFGDGVDCYDMEICIPNGGESLEAESLRSWLDRWIEYELSQEELTARIGDQLAKTLSVEYTVELTGTHSGIEYTTTGQ